MLRDIEDFDQATVDCPRPSASKTSLQDFGATQNGGRLGAVRNEGSLWEFRRASANSIAALYP